MKKVPKMVVNLTPGGNFKHLLYFQFSFGFFFGGRNLAKKLFVK